MDSKTFSRLLDTHRDQVYGYALHFLRDPDDAADVTQETFMRLWHSGPDPVGPRGEAWLLRVAYNLCVDQARRRRTVRRTLGQADVEALDSVIDDSGRGDPERDLLLERRRLRLHEALAGLTDETRGVVLMHYFQGLKLSEIAELLDRNVNSLKVLLHRTRRTLRGSLETGPSPLPGRQETG